MISHIRRLKRKQGILIAVIIGLIIAQFFLVHSTYITLEVGKVFKWTFFYISPIILLGTLAFLKRLRRKLFPDPHESRWVNFKNSAAVLISIMMILSVFGFDTIIQTNDWFGSEESYHFHTEIKGVEEKEPTRRSFYSSPTYDIIVSYRGKLVQLNCKRKYYSGQMFVENVNVGGAWGILFSKE